MGMHKIDEILMVNRNRFGNKIAYQCGNTSLSFVKTEEVASQIAVTLREHNAINNVPIAIYMERCLDFIACVFGVIMSGNAYLPLDAKDNSQRLYDILDDSNTQFIITKQRYVKNLEEYIKASSRLIVIFIADISNVTPLTIVDGFSRYNGKRPKSLTVPPGHSGESIAYIIYTSGTTGKSKGVAVRHNSVLNFIKNTIKIFGFTEETKILSTKSFCFDASITDILCPFFAGGIMIIDEKVEILPRRILKHIRECSLTHVSFTPVVLKMLIDTDTYTQEDFKSVRTLSIGGDSIQPHYIYRFKKKVPHVRVFNRYGPTECTVVVSSYEITEDLDEDRIPIGTPYENVNFYIVNDNKIVTESGVRGELYIGGFQVMKGYWNNSEMTENVLDRNIVQNDIVYKTGDLAYMRPDSQYVFVGRNNEVIKKNGYRINLNEIKEALLKHSAVTDCICLFFEDSQTIIAIAQTSEMPESLIQFLKGKISPFMIPDVIHTTHQIPYTDRGKPNISSIKRDLE